MHNELTRKDLELMKKKHRAKEMREIMEADMKYLKALFHELEKERREGASGIGGGSNNSNGSGVSLELAGVEMAASMPEMPVEAAGGSIDVSI